MQIMDILKQKTSTKDLINLGSAYYEAKSIKEYLKLAKKCRGLDITQCPKTLKLTVEHDSGKANFNPVTIKSYDDEKNVTYISHATKNIWVKERGKYTDIRTAKTGAAWIVEL